MTRKDHLKLVELRAQYRSLEQKWIDIDRKKRAVNEEIIRLEEKQRSLLRKWLPWL